MARCFVVFVVLLLVICSQCAFGARNIVSFTKNTTHALTEFSNKNYTSGSVDGIREASLLVREMLGSVGDFVQGSLNNVADMVGNVLGALGAGDVIHVSVP
ncbi:hypothetical protein BVRB_1g019840 [Beta vulgaris subsp. vulgaris]|nr:hypothetical protein BVRB_1g019840 [Beta vulgaris subsp. vulgaris]